MQSINQTYLRINTRNEIFFRLIIRCCFRLNRYWSSNFYWWSSTSIQFLVRTTHFEIQYHLSTIKTRKLIFLNLFFTLGDECVDTVGWNDQMNNFTCSDYVTLGWCLNKAIVTSLQNKPMSSLNFPDSNCCACGKKGEYRRNFSLQKRIFV